MNLPPEIRKLFAKAGRKGGLIGGKITSEAKTAACRANAKKPRPRRSDYTQINAISDMVEIQSTTRVTKKPTSHATKD